MLFVLCVSLVCLFFVLLFVFIWFVLFCSLPEAERLCRGAGSVVAELVSSGVSHSCILGESSRPKPADDATEDLMNLMENYWCHTSTVLAPQGAT